MQLFQDYQFQCPINEASVEHLTRPDSSGFTQLHLAALRGDVGAVRPDCLAKSYLLRPDKFGRTAIHFAAMAGHLDKFPPGVLTVEMLLFKSEDPDVELDPPPLWAVQNRGIEQVPVSLLAPDLMLIRNFEGHSIIQRIAQAGHFRRIPQELLTHEVLTNQNESGQCALHIAAEAETIHQIAALLTPEMMQVVDGSGVSVTRVLCEYAEYLHEHLEAFPENVKAILLAELIAS